MISVYLLDVFSVPKQKTEVWQQSLSPAQPQRSLPEPQREPPRPWREGTRRGHMQHSRNPGYVGSEGSDVRTAVFRLKWNWKYLRLNPLVKNTCMTRHPHRCHAACQLCGFPMRRAWAWDSQTQSVSGKCIVSQERNMGIRVLRILQSNGSERSTKAMPKSGP